MASGPRRRFTRPSPATWMLRRSSSAVGWKADHGRPLWLGAGLERRATELAGIIDGIEDGGQAARQHPAPNWAKHELRHDQAIDAAESGVVVDQPGARFRWLDPPRHDRRLALVTLPRVAQQARRLHR